jgi:uncharacterized protein (TIGR00730 family)
MSTMPSPAIRSAVVFCGSRLGNDPAWQAAAEQLGRGMAQAGIRLIYGGGRTGLMGKVADGALAAGGDVTGIIPGFLQAREVSHTGVTDLIVTASMHVRKQRMSDMADAFIVMPGGLGTLDETMEIITWRQLGLHDKPILIVNVKGWATRLLAMLDGFIADGYSEPSTRNLYEVLPDVPAVLSRLAELTIPQPADAARL